MWLVLIDTVVYSNNAKNPLSVVVNNATFFLLIGDSCVVGNLIHLLRSVKKIGILWPSVTRENIMNIVVIKFKEFALGWILLIFGK